MIQSVDASQLVISQPDKVSGIDLQLAFYDINHQLVSNIPYQAMEQIQEIDSISITCTLVTTNINYYVRVYSYDQNGIHTLQRNYFIPGSACINTGDELNVPFTPLDVSGYFDIHSSIAIGIYTDSLIESIYTFGENVAINYQIPPINTPSLVTDQNWNPVYFPDPSHDQILTVFHKVYGTLKFPSTPTPTPTPSVTPTLTVTVPPTPQPTATNQPNTTATPPIGNVTPLPPPDYYNPPSDPGTYNGEIGNTTKEWKNVTGEGNNSNGTMGSWTNSSTGQITGYIDTLTGLVNNLSGINTSRISNTGYILISAGILDVIPDEIWGIFVMIIVLALVLNFFNR